MEIPAIAQILDKLLGKALAELFYAGSQFLFHDSFVFLLLVIGLEILPGQGTAQEIHKHIPQRLQIISPSLFDSNVGVNGGVSCSSRQILVFSIGNMLAVSLDVPLCQSKINDENLMRPLSGSNEKIIWLDIPMQKVAGMDVLDTRDQLISDHQHCL